MVGHHWLRAPELAPTAELSKEIAETLEKIEAFAKKVHSGEIVGSAGAFKNLLSVGMPGRDKMKVFFLDNTDADG